MKRKAKFRVVLSVFLLTTFCLSSLTGCSSFRNMVSWLPFVDSEEERQDPEVTKFMAGVRPYKGDPGSVYRLACHFQERKRYELAIEEFKKVIQIDPTFERAYNGMGVSYDMLGQYHRAVQSYTTALALNPDLHYVHNNLGYSYLLQGDLDSAIEAFRLAVVLNNTNKRYHNNLGLAYAKKGQYDLAFAEFKAAGDEAAAHQKLARFYYQNGMYEVSRQHLALAQSIKQNDRQIATELAAAQNLASISESSPNSTAEHSGGANQTGSFRQSNDPDDKLAPPILRVAFPDSTQGDDKTILSKSEVTVAASFAPKIMENAAPSENKPFWIIAGGNNPNPEKEKNDHAPYVASLTSPGDLDNVHRNLLNTEANGTLETPKPVSKPHQVVQVELPLPGANRLDSPQGLNGFEIEIANGNGLNQMARRVSNYLHRKGFGEPYVTNAEHFEHYETKIYYSEGFLQEAYRVAQEIPGYQNMERVTYLGRPDLKIRVLIGKDLAVFDEVFAKM